VRDCGTRRVDRAAAAVAGLFGVFWTVRVESGMNWGIFSLLAVVVFVLSSIAAFFIYLAKRAAATSRVIDQTAGLTSRSLQSSLAANREPGDHPNSFEQ